MRASAEDAVPASPTTLMSGSASSRSRTPRRTTSWSSKRNTAIGALASSPSPEPPTGSATVTPDVRRCALTVLSCRAVSHVNSRQPGYSKVRTKVPGVRSRRPCLCRRGVQDPPAGVVMFISMFDQGDILDGLNEQQRRAVTHEGGPLLVLAGAGTGKTRTLVARAAWLRDAQGLPSSRILLLTFTRRAASDMLARAASAGNGSAGGPERIYGGTFHAIAHKIIRQHAESFSLPPQFTILDQSDTTDLLDVLRPEPRPGRDRPAGAPGGDVRRHLYPVREHRAAGQRGARGQLPVVRAVHQPAGRPVPRLHRPQARPPPGGLRRPAVAVAGGAGRPGGRAGAARHVRRGPGRRVPGRQRGAGQHRAAAAARRQAADLRGRRRAGHLRLPRCRPGPSAAAGRRLPGPGYRPPAPQLPVPAGRAGPGQPDPPVRARPGPGADRRPRARSAAPAGPLP